MLHNLQKTAWETPRHYFGFSPIGDYCVMTRHRDSDALTRSNWAEACKLLGAVAYDDGREGFATRPAVYHWRAGCSMVGWIEYLMVRTDAPADILERADNMLGELAQYPVLNDDALSELEYEEASAFWESLDVRERARMIAETECGASIFAARRAELPRDDSGALFELLRA